eukprot:4078151-Prymnesium_polylepis.1
MAGGSTAVCQPTGAAVCHLRLLCVVCSPPPTGRTVCCAPEPWFRSHVQPWRHVRSCRVLCRARRRRAVEHGARASAREHPLRHAHWQGGQEGRCCAQGAPGGCARVQHDAQQRDARRARVRECYLALRGITQGTDLQRGRGLGPCSSLGSSSIAACAGAC